jgi:hypothetical protein
VHALAFLAYEGDVDRPEIVRASTPGSCPGRPTRSSRKAESIDRLSWRQGGWLECLVGDVGVAAHDAIGTELASEVDEVVVVRVAKNRWTRLWICLDATEAADLVDQLVYFCQGEEAAESWSPKHVADLGE